MEKASHTGRPSFLYIYPRGSLPRPALHVTLQNVTAISHFTDPELINSRNHTPSGPDEPPVGGSRGVGYALAHGRLWPCVRLCAWAKYYIGVVCVVKFGVSWLRFVVGNGSR